MSGWSRKEFSEKGGVPDRKVLFYTEQGMFPDLRLDVGRGKARVYTNTELRDLRLIIELTKSGLPLAKIRDLISYVHSICDEWMPKGKLIKSPFFVSWDMVNGKPQGFYVSEHQTKGAIEKIESPLMLQINLTAIFSGLEE